MLLASSNSTCRNTSRSCDGLILKTCSGGPEFVAQTGRWESLVKTFKYLFILSENRKAPELVNPDYLGLLYLALHLTKTTANTDVAFALLVMTRPHQTLQIADGGQSQKVSTWVVSGLHHSTVDENSCFTRRTFSFNIRNRLKMPKYFVTRMEWLLAYLTTIVINWTLSAPNHKKRS